MSSNPKLIINLNKIYSNSQTIVTMCKNSGIDVIGVTKGVSGDNLIAQAIMAGGVKGLADSRIENIVRMREAGIVANFMLLRSPMLSEVELVVNYCDISLNTEIDVLEELSILSLKKGIRHNVLLMIDVGELREGILPSDIFRIGNYIKILQGIRVAGIGTNLTCLNGVMPTRENMSLLMDTGNELEKILEYKMEYISGGNSSSLCLMEGGIIPQGINQFRVGESILLGHYVPEQDPIPDTYQDAFQLETELIELKEKPSLPMGVIGENAFGEYTNEKEQRLHYRGIVAIGRQDVPPAGLIPLNHGVSVIGATSDHTIIDIGDDKGPYQVGSKIVFGLTYPGLLSASTSPYVTKEYIRIKDGEN